MLVSMMLGCFSGMIRGMQPMPVCDLRVMRGLFMVPGFMMFSGFFVVSGCVLMMFRSFLVVLSAFMFCHRLHSCSRCFWHRLIESLCFPRDKTITVLCDIALHHPTSDRSGR